jgi:hypothetical protein
VPMTSRPANLSSAAGAHETPGHREGSEQVSELQGFLGEAVGERQQVVEAGHFEDVLHVLGP